MATIEQLAEALDTIAEYLNEPEQKKDGEIVNLYAYNQQQLLRQIRIQAVYAAQRANEDYDSAKAKAEQAVNSYTAGEIGERQLETAVYWLQRRTNQALTMNGLLDTITATWDKHVAEPFEMPKEKNAPKPDVATTVSALERLQQLGIKVNEPNNGGGIDDYASVTGSGKPTRATRHHQAA